MRLLTQISRSTRRVYLLGGMCVRGNLIPYRTGVTKRALLSAYIVFDPKDRGASQDIQIEGCPLPDLLNEIEKRFEVRERSLTQFVVRILRPGKFVRD